MEIKCPRCESTKINFIDTDHQEILFKERVGYLGGIYGCPNCKIEFGVWTEFKIEVTDRQIEWIDEDCYDD